MQNNNIYREKFARFSFTLLSLWSEGNQVIYKRSYNCFYKTKELGKFQDYVN